MELRADRGLLIDSGKQESSFPGGQFLLGLLLGIAAVIFVIAVSL